jgi:hypothetical protein
MADEKSKKNAMLNLIEQGEEGIHNTNNTLARVWRILLYRYGLTGHQWQRQITKYQEKINKISSKKGSANMKGNMTRRLAEAKLSWGTLMRGFAIMEIDRLEITFKCYKKNDCREITMVVLNDEFNALDDEDEEGEV